MWGRDGSVPAEAEQGGDLPRNPRRTDTFPESIQSMNQDNQASQSRRDFLRASIVVATPLAFALGSGQLRLAAPSSASNSAAPVLAQELLPTPECADTDDLTPPQTEGPYFKPSSPERTSLLEPGMLGTKLSLSGYVLTRSCQPVAGALLDFWQTDERGEYDNVGYRMRGHQFTDASGRYVLETVVPGLYPGRTRHIHLKVQAPNQPILTTQLYFPNEARNQRDGIFNPELVIAMADGPDGKLGGFNFVLNVA
jgi:protocatechuate 3,4-dioxygenase beta subunit